MGVAEGAKSYEQQGRDVQRFWLELFRDEMDLRIKALDMTTDPEEGRRQIEAMQPEPIKVGDNVRLAAGGERTMTVVDLEDYGNSAVCEWVMPRPDGSDAIKYRDTFPVRSLMRVEPQTSGG